MKAPVTTHFPFAALLCAIYFMLAFGAAPGARADDPPVPVAADVCPTYPKRLPGLKKWLKREMVPGRTRQEAVVALFGRKYHHPHFGFDGEDHMRYDESIIVYKLDDLGVSDHAPHDALFCFFDERSGLLVRVAVAEDEEE
jgi:hypothetical protein